MRGKVPAIQSKVLQLVLSTCTACGVEHLWWSGRIVHPPSRGGVLANADMPDDVRTIYDEAREVAPISPKSAAALLRLALQLLVDELVEGKDNLNAKIGTLVRRGLSPRIQRAMDTLRIAGNESVHPGTIDLDDDSSMLEGLFVLMNLIVDEMISRSKHIDELYEALPDGPREAIERRDAKATGA